MIIRKCVYPIAINYIEYMSRHFNFWIINYFAPNLLSEIKVTIQIKTDIAVANIFYWKH